MQLPPVSKTTGGAYCFRQPATLTDEVHLWHLFDFCELPQSMRQGNDTTFVDILNNLRVGQLTIQQLEILDSRRVDVNDLNEVIRVFPTTKQVDYHNQKMINILAKTTKLYKLQAVETKTYEYGQKPKDLYVSDDPNKTGGIVKHLTIGLGSRVMLRRNLKLKHGLVNGAMGVVRTIEWPALRRDQLEPGELPQAVYIKFDDKAIRNNIPGVGVKIEPSTTEFDALRGEGKIKRKMLPLILCWGVTVHKLQGTPLDRAVLDLSSRIFAKG